MMRGRKPKPTALRVIEGGPGHSRPINREEPDAGPVGAPPGDLAGVALAKWHDMTRLWRLVATEADRDQLAEYCRLEAMRVEAEGEVARNGVMMVTPNGCAVQTPWMQILNRVREDMRKIAVEFGGTPVSRTRVTALPGPQRSKFDGLILDH